MNKVISVYGFRWKGSEANASFYGFFSTLKDAWYNTYRVARLMPLEWVLIIRINGYEYMRIAKNGNFIYTIRNFDYKITVIRR